MLMHRVYFLVSLLAIPLTAAAGWGQVPLKLPPAKVGKLDNLIPIMVPSATCVAISETAGWLAFGHDRTFADAQVSLVRLDAKGNPAAYSVPIKLPRPVTPALAKIPNYALSLAFHPKLPLLYVWQDIGLALANPPAPLPPDLVAFDHLLIYNVSKEIPELVTSLCRGQEYLFGCAGGGIMVDPAGSYLYVPNIKDAKLAALHLKLGRFELDEAGLPKLDEKDAKLPPPLRIKKIAELNVTKPLMPHQTTLQEYIILFPFNPYGCGFSFYSVAKDVVIAGGWNGLMTWRPDDKRVTLYGVSFRHLGNTLITSHPNMPALYVTVFNTDVMYRAEHSDGYLSGVPAPIVVPEANLLSPPAVFAKGKKLAVGAKFRVYVMSLDDQGKVRPELMEVPLLNPAVQALIYSEKHDRLYVSVEISK